MNVTVSWPLDVVCLSTVHPRRQARRRCRPDYKCTGQSCVCDDHGQCLRGGNCMDLSVTDAGAGGSVDQSYSRVIEAMMRAGCCV